MRTITLALAGCGLFGAALLMRGEEGSTAESLLSKVKLGEHWSGPQLDVGDLKGRVTLVEFWGYN